MTMNIDPQFARDPRPLRQRLHGAPKVSLAGRPTAPEMALSHALHHHYQALQTILETLTPEQLVDLAEAATRLRREAEAAYHSRRTGMPTHLTPRLKLHWDADGRHWMGPC